MSLASNTVFPSGGRLGRRPRAWARLLVSSASAVGFAAVLVGLVALGTHRSAGAGSATAATRKSVLTPKKIVEATALSGDLAPAVAPSGPAVAKAAASSPAPNPAQAGSPSPSIATSGDPAPPSSSVDFTPIVPSVIPYGSGSTDPQDANGAAPAALADAGATAASLAATPTDDQAPPTSRTGPDTAASEPAAAAASPYMPVGQTESAPPAAPRRQIKASPRNGQPLALVSADEAGEPAPAPASGSSAAAGGYAAYLSTSATEAEARGLLAPLQRKYVAELRGQHLSYHRMRVNGSVVYRVRVGRLAEASAQSLCQKLRTAAGSCDVGPE